LRHRERLVELYPEIFGGAEDNNIDTTFTGFNKKWGWAGFIFGLCNGDILNVDDVSKISVHTAFMFSSYKIDWQSIQEKLIKKPKK
jgi:hypothetical protein